MLNIANIIMAVCAAAVGFALGPLSCILLNKIPAKWLCDYDEEPSPELLTGKRYKPKTTGVLMGIILAAAMAAVALVQGNAGRVLLTLLLLECLLLISMSDAKYTIIPDQFTIAAAVISAVFTAVDLFMNQMYVEPPIYIDKWYYALLGAVSGAGILIVLDLISMFIFKRSGFGFGDVKLLAALGLYFGFPYAIVVLAMSFIVAAVHFFVIIFSGKAKRGIYIPMGPYICIAAALTIILTPQLQSLFSMYSSLMNMTVLP